MIPNLKLFLFETVGQDMDGVFLILLALYKVRRNELYNSFLTFTNDLGSLSYSFLFLNIYYAYMLVIERIDYY